ncbi:MAG: S8 family serine peptidase [Acetobacteraceae bacterium]
MSEPASSEYNSYELTLSSDDLAILRRSDPALVAAGLAALYRADTELVTSLLVAVGLGTDQDLPVLPNGGSEDTFLRSVQRRTGFKLSREGRIEPADQTDLTLDKPSITSVTVRVPLGNGGTTGGDRERISVGLRLLAEWLRDALAKNVRLQLPPRISPSLQFSVPSIHASPADLPAPPQRDGRGVVVGVIDWGCDFVHPAFRHPDGTTRLRYLWDQNLPPAGGNGAPGPGGLGRVFDAATLNYALQTPNPYWTLDYSPDHNLFAPRVPGTPVHGTHVMGVAAGSAAACHHEETQPSCECETTCDKKSANAPAEPRTGYRAAALPPGVAPGADLIFVHLPPKGVPTSQDPSSGAALLQAVLWLFSKAEPQPTVVNLSLGTNSGSHDGSSILEVALDWILNQPGRMIVLPAGNSYDADLHASGTVPVGGKSSLTWIFKEGDPTINVMDVWYETGTPDPVLTVTLTAPDKTEYTQAAPGAPLLITRFNRLVGTVTTGVQPNPSAPGFLQQIHIELWSIRFEKEDWRLGLNLSVGTDPVQFHAWIDRDDLSSQTQSNFAPNEADRSSTLASLSCGRNTLCVGAYYEIPPGQPITSFTGAGPTRDGRPKPDVAAPGWRVLSANAYGGPLQEPGSKTAYSLTAPMDGTSVSVPHVTGLVALALQTQPTSSAKQIGDLVRSWTQVMPPTIEPPIPPIPPVPPRNWDERFGYGRIDAAKTLWNQP